MHLIFGATGTVGRHVLQMLLAHGEAVRAASRVATPDPRAQFAGVDLASGDGLEAAVRGATTIFLTTGDMVDQAGAEIRVIDAATRAGVTRIVKLSVLGAGSRAFYLARVHQRIEQALARSGTPFTILRPGGFMQNYVNHYAHWIRTEGALRLPCASARENLVDARDIAAVAAVCLRDDAAPGRTLDLLGPEAMDYHDMMATLSREAGGSWAYVPIGDEEFRRRMQPYVVTPEHLEGLIDMFAFHRSGRAPTSSRAVPSILGVEPRSFAAFAREHAHVWSGAPATEGLSLSRARRSTGSTEWSMLFRHGVLRGIAEGRVTLAFRRWRRTPPVDGSLLRTPVGIVCLERVTVVRPDDITPRDVDRTGLSADELRTSIAGHGSLLRIQLRFAVDDPRIALQQRLPEGDDMEMLRTRLARIDAAASTPWTTRFLQLIAHRPGISSRELARRADADVPQFKRRVHRLKKLGLTESLEIGYRLSPRGRALLARLARCGD